MKFVSITGPREDIDRVVNNYLSRYEIHLENALTELTDVKNLSPYLEINPYKEALSTVGSFYEEVENPEQASAKKLPIEKALSFVQQIKDEADVLNKTRQELEEKRDSLAESLRIIYPFRNVDFDVQSILKMRYIHYRFGRIEKDYFDKFKTYIYDNLDTIFIKCDEDDRYIWGIYFVPVHEAQRIHAVYSAMHFEKIFVPDQYDGTAKAAYTALEAQYKKTIADLDANKAARKAFFRKNASDIVSCKHTLSQFSRNFDIRKLAACTHGDNKGEAAADYKPKEPFYILCGWMTEKDAKAFQNDISGDSRIFCLIDENEQEDAHKTPPTKLKNPKLFKPFEMYTKMYGLPAYGEMDPTWFIAITYSFIFGAMFGDAGQGLLLLIGGFLLYKFKKINLAAIISCCGFFSTIFGCLFGSVFGFEDVIQARWLRPVDAMTNLPFIGQLNTVFVVAIAFGMGLNILVMIFNVINAVKSHDLENMLFSHNGIAGLVFYGFLVLTIVLYMTGHKVPGNILMVIFLGVPVILFVFKEPLGNLVTKQHKKMEEGKVMFFVQSFFELFETMLSYFSNTISYVRIGAFAVSHAAMMEVVLMLSGASAGHTNWIVFVLGNVLVCGLEGLVVGIQVLRLEYYEMFSRFYKGTGREFKPFHSQSDRK